MCLFTLSLQAQVDCDCPDPTEEDQVCVDDGFGTVFPFPSACWAACFQLTVVDGECDDIWDGGDWPETDCDCPEPTPEDEVCVDDGFGGTFPCPSACLAECNGYTVVEGECDCDWDGDWESDSTWVNITDCDCEEEPSEEDAVCVDDGFGGTYPFPSACWAECFGLTVVDGECDYDWEDGEGDWPGDDNGDWPGVDCDCEEPTEADEVCVEDEFGVYPFPSACYAECFGLTVVDGECDYDWDGGDWEDGDWESDSTWVNITDCDCEEEPSEEDAVCVDDGFGGTYPFASACWAECFGLTVVDGECDYDWEDGEGDWPGDDNGDWPGVDCDCEEPTEDDVVCVEDENGEVFSFPSACWAECFGLTVVEGECDYDWEGNEGDWPGDIEDHGECWEDILAECGCDEPTEDDIVCVEDGFGNVFALSLIHI